MKDHKELIKELREYAKQIEEHPAYRNFSGENVATILKNVADVLENYEQDQWNLGPEQPPIRKAVLITIENDGKREVETGIYRELGVRPYIYERGGYLRTGEVVAWREVPEPYKGE